MPSGYNVSTWNENQLKHFALGLRRQDVQILAFLLTGHSTLNKHLAIMHAAVWRSGSIFGCINDVDLHRTWLVLGRVTIFGQAIHLSV